MSGKTVVEFIWPVMLWALALVPLLWLGQRMLACRQRKVAEQFADPRLLEYLLVRPPSWQHTVWLLCYLVSILALALALARPVAAVPMLVNRAVVILAIDASQSMIGTDIAPNRLEAARRAARAFVALLPRSTKVGLVEFSEYGTVLVAPTTDRDALLEALAHLQLRSATAVGAGILEAVRARPAARSFWVSGWTDSRANGRVRRLRIRQNHPLLLTISLPPRSFFFLTGSATSALIPMKRLRLLTMAVSGSSRSAWAYRAGR